MPCCCMAGEPPPLGDSMGSIGKPPGAAHPAAAMLPGPCCTYQAAMGSNADIIGMPAPG